MPLVFVVPSFERNLDVVYDFFSQSEASEIPQPSPGYNRLTAHWTWKKENKALVLFWIQHLWWNMMF